MLGYGVLEDSDIEVARESNGPAITVDRRNRSGIVVLQVTKRLDRLAQRVRSGGDAPEDHLRRLVLGGPAARWRLRHELVAAVHEIDDDVIVR